MEWIEGHINTLVRTTGMCEDAARRLFLKPVEITLAPEVRGNRTYELAFSTAVNLVSRVFPRLWFEPSDLTCIRITPWGKFEPLEDRSSPELRIQIGAPTNLQKSEVSLVLNEWKIFIDQDQPAHASEAWNPVLAIIGAAYLTSAVIIRLLEGAVAGALEWRPFSILDFENGQSEYDFDNSVKIGKVHVAGIGAIGSAFLYSLAAHGRCQGELTLIDRDIVDTKNLGRCPLFDASEINAAKVHAAAEKLNAVHALDVVPYQDLFQTYIRQRIAEKPGFRIEGLVSAPDRRETRRVFQHELPRQMWDASTGIDQVVVHVNNYDPRFACTECIYSEHPSETAHLAHVADVLGLNLEAVKNARGITAKEAEAISERYPHLSADSLVGKDYDSVFRDLCSANQIRVGDEFVLAPMSSVSMLAGAYLYLEFLKTFSPEGFKHLPTVNYYQVNPLFPPNPLLREMRKSRPGCTCQTLAYRKTFERLWSWY